MKITPELIEKYHLIKAGNAYYGAFARDNSDHAAVVVSIYNDIVNYFSITSSKEFIEGIQRNREKNQFVGNPARLKDSIISFLIFLGISITDIFFMISLSLSAPMFPLCTGLYSS